MSGRFRRTALSTLCFSILLLASAAPATEFEVSFPADLESGSIDGRIILMLSPDADDEPRFQVRPGVKAIQIFGVDVEAMAPGDTVRFDESVLGYPIETIGDVPPGPYQVQALLHRYETFERADGHTLKLPMDRGEGQQWNRAPGNLYSVPREVVLQTDGDEPVPIELGAAGSES